MSGSDWLLRDAMREARREGLTYGLRHIAFNPAQFMTDTQLSEFAQTICREFHADPEHITFVIHQKDGSTHGHLLLPEWQQDHILDSRFSWIRLEKLARLEEIRLGHALVAGRHDRSIVKALEQEGRDREAEQIKALIPATAQEKPRSAYSAQARRMAERQGADLPALKKLICALWAQSDGLKSFRAALAEHDLLMREGDRTETRPGAHIIEDRKGTLIGSFTRLTKVRMAEFRTLLAQEKQQTAPQIKPVLPPGRIPVRGMKDSLNKTAPAPTGRIHRTMSLDEIRQRACIVGIIREKTVILTRQAPESSPLPLNRTHSLTQWRNELRGYQKQLRRYRKRYSTAKKEWQKAQASWWRRLSGISRRRKQVMEEKFLQLLDMIRYVVQALLHITGLRAIPPEPLRTILTPQDKPALERFIKEYDDEFTAMAQPVKLSLWLNQRFDRMVRARDERIRRWDKVHQPEKEQAGREITQLRALLKTRPDTPEHRELVHQLTHLLPAEIFRPPELKPEPKQEITRKDTPKQWKPPSM
ncbi:hypothetical protein [Acetobacter thailandicus]|uniref:MobA/MobL protein domain-containing protein n=1 Tax=Acetobacter thailandicus TaxID=1502842 RepID=A0ABT3QCK5_9PROT|nr:hypothetical protein [Acetobacter thailandicus]MCX2563005.1 hypothetical protein [Acetobacter thailandicus]